MDANGNLYQQSRVSGWKRNTNHSRNSRRKRRTLKGSTPSRLCSTAASETIVTSTIDSKTSTIITEKRPRGVEDRVHMSLEELRNLLPNTDVTGSALNSGKNSPKSQEELLAMAVEYLRTRQHNRSIAPSDHNAKGTPHNKRSRRKHEHQPNNGQMTESAATPQHTAAYHPTSTTTTTDAMLEGFRECMEETIRYLVEVERLAPDHDIVVRLRAHLLKAQAKLDLNNRVVEGSRLDAVSSCNARVKRGYGSAAGGAAARTTMSHGSTSSTQTSPEVMYAKSPQIPVWVPSGTSAGHAGTLSSSRPVTSISRSTGLPDSSTATKVMKPLTVDTNQYYAMPSPLSHCSSDSNQSGHNSNESLLTIARTVPTTTQPMYSTACVTGKTLSYRRHQNAAAHGTYLQRPVHSTCPTMVYSTTALTAPITATALPASVTSATGHHLGFNLNYVAPYIMAWVRPAQQ